MGIHVFFDNSNIWGGAQALRLIKEPSVPWMALRLHYENLFDLVEGGRDAQTAILAGSIPPSCEALWEYARRQGYGTDLLRRVTNDDGRVTEQGVDEVLHLKMANALLDFAAPQTLVVATGDGRLSSFDTGFPSQIERALRVGWNVEVWTFSANCNRCYHRMARDSAGRLQVMPLDPYYEAITFVKGGEYYNKDEQGQKTFFTIPERVVAPLPRKTSDRKSTRLNSSHH